MDAVHIGYSDKGVKINKKVNMEYWDNIDWLAEGYIKSLLKYSMPFGGIEDEENEILEMGKEITEFAIKMLEERCGAYFPYVDENY